MLEEQKETTVVAMKSTKSETENEVREHREPVTWSL